MAKVSRTHNPDLPFVLEGYQGNPLIDGVFCNEGATEKEETSLMTVLKWQLQSNPQKEEKKADTFRVPLKVNNTFWQESKDCLVWLGHASFFFRIGGINFLTDPCLTDLPFIKRKVDTPCRPEDIRNIDYLLLSHNHRDHLDFPSLKKILPNNLQAKLLLPLETANYIKKEFSDLSLDCQEAGWYQPFQTN